MISFASLVALTLALSLRERGSNPVHLLKSSPGWHVRQ